MEAKKRMSYTKAAGAASLAFPRRSMGTISPRRVRVLATADQTSSPLVRSPAPCPGSNDDHLLLRATCCNVKCYLTRTLILSWRSRVQ